MEQKFSQILNESTDFYYLNFYNIKYLKKLI